MTILLFAETPRFSNEGHRFLVPVGESPPESVLGDFARAAIESQSGVNYLAATRRATQVLEYGTVRVGSELLVLAGLDIARLTIVQLLAVQTWLYSKLDSLSVGGPGKPTTRLVIERLILNEWLEDPILEHLATADWSHGPRALQDTPRGIAAISVHSRAIVLGLIASHSALLCLGGMATHRWFPPSQASAWTIPPKSMKRSGAPVISGDAESGTVSSATTTAADPLRPIGTPTDEVYEKAKSEFAAAVAWLPESQMSSILRAFPSSQGAPCDSLCEQVSLTLDLRNREGKFQETIRLVEAAAKLPWAKAFGACLKGSREVAEQGIDSLDQDLYAKIQEITSDLRNRLSPIEEYLRSAPRKYMASEVKKYRDWLNKPPSIEILEVRPSTPSSVERSPALCSVTVRIGQRSLTLTEVPTGKRLNTGLYRVRLDALAVDPWDQLVDIEVSVDRGPTLFTRNCPLKRTAPPEHDLPLSSKSLFSRANAHVLLRVPELVDVPMLPPWKRPDEANVPDR